MKRLLCIWAVVVAGVSGSAPPVEGGAVRYPHPRVNGVEWFYVFGRDGNPTYGAEAEPKAFFIEVPQHVSDPVVIRVLDADIRGQRDEQDGVWDTATKFSVFGGSTLLRSKAVTPKEADGAVVEFGPFRAEEGEAQGDRVVFRLEVEGLEGDDNNLFAVEVEPSQAQLFAFSPAIRLAKVEGTPMRFYPEIPTGTSTIRVGNHDLDPDGGSAVLIQPAEAGRGGWAGAGRIYRLRNSGTARWAWTDLAVPQELTGARWTYQITKATQPRANASLRVEDADGKPLRMYFTPGAPIQVAKAPNMPCNTFEFDASTSYDPDNQQLSYTWDLGDGASAEGIRTRHTYAKAGDYRVLLTATDNSTAECRQSKTEQWLRVNTPPHAVLTAPAMACAGSSVRLSAAKSTDAPGDQLSYRWDLGDGVTADGSEVTHVYNTGGAYQVKLLVDDGRGTSCSMDRAVSVIRVNSPPIAKANDQITACTRNPADPLKVAFDGAASLDPDNDRLAYRWDFGDGSQAEGARVSHAYQKGGAYTAKLVVDDGSGTSCAMAMAAVPVRLNRAPIASASRDLSSCAFDSLAFDAGSSADPDGDALAYRWDFGDGQTASGPSVKHRYTKGGLYQVSMAVDDGSGMACAQSAASFNVRVNSRPAAVFKADETGCAGQHLAFDAIRSSDPDGQGLQYAWDFGDGTTAQGAKVRHAYAKGGRYPVALRVDDGQGTACSFSLAKADVRVNTPPMANAGHNLVCCLGQTNIFDASTSFDADGEALTYQWDFGDGRLAEGPRVEHAYREHGTYPVRLTVSDGSGNACGTSTSGFLAAVNAPPVARMAIVTDGGRVLPPTAGQELAKR